MIRVDGGSVDQTKNTVGNVVSENSLASIVKEVMKELGLQNYGDYKIPESGRIASNTIVSTAEKGNVMVRFYPKGCQDSKLETGNVDFEVEALSHYAAHKLPVPTPFLFKNSSPLFKTTDGLKVFAYCLLDGTPIEHSELSLEKAKKASRLLESMLKAALLFKPGENRPSGDIEYICSIADKFLERNSSSSLCKDIREMKSGVEGLNIVPRLSKTPTGIVHADFFFENVIIDSEGVYKTIDFGDAYYGHVVQDIVIGAMEFCVLEDDSWNTEFFTAFLQIHADRLKEWKVDFSLFYDLLIANCLRFAVYTCAQDLEKDENTNSNPYIERYKNLKTHELRDRLEGAYPAK